LEGFLQAAALAATEDCLGKKNSGLQTSSEMWRSADRLGWTSEHVGKPGLD
jgi:hypothetical protein